MTPTDDDTRAFIITDTNRGGLVIIASTTLMTWMVLCFMFRVYTRMHINGPLGVDDLAAGAGMVFGVVHVGVLVKAVSHGLGKSTSLLDATGLIAAEKGLYFSDILFLLGHYAAKISTALLVRRLGRERFYRRVCLVVVGGLTIWAIISILVVCIRCDMSEPWHITNRCVNMKLRWQVETALDVLGEISILGIVIYLVWDLRMPLIRKAVVVAAFGCRVPLIAIAIVRINYIDGAINAIDPTLGSVNSSIATEALLHYSLMAATIPCLKPFVVAFNTGWGQGNRKASNYAFRDSAQTSKRFSRSARRESFLPRRSIRNSYDRTAETVHDTSGYRTEAERGAVESEESQGMVIRETRSWVVEHETYELAQYHSGAAQGHNETTCSVKG